MSTFFIVLQQIIGFFLMIGTGILAKRIKIINDTALGVMSKLAVNIALPCYIFYNTIVKSTRAGLVLSLPVMPMVILIYVFLFIITFGLTKVFKLKGNKAHVFVLCFVFGNGGMIGIPLSSAVYPDTAIVYYSLSTMIDMLVLWSYGVTLSYDTSKHKKIDFRTLLNVVKSPALISVVLAMLFVVFQIPVHDIISSTLSKIGGMFQPLGLLYIGGMLSWDIIKESLKRVEIYVGIIVKMLIFPIVIFLICRFIGLPADMQGTLTIIAGLPTFMVAIMLCSMNGSDDRYAAGISMINTVACLITYPVVSLITAFI